LLSHHKRFCLAIFVCLLATVAVLPNDAHHLRLGDPAFADPASKPQSSVTITLLSTTDIHGHVEPWDYYANKPANLGLAKISTLVMQARAEAPQALLLDCGDTIQGTPLAYYFARKDTSQPNPTIAAFNAMKYDAMAVGNHEFNFGEDVMWKAKGESKFPWLAANVKQTYTEGVQRIRPFIIKNVEGVRVGIVGFVTRVRYSRDSALGTSVSLQGIQIRADCHGREEGDTASPCKSGSAGRNHAFRTRPQS
jgi:2',3'-cyclic-nucleotide 2'-phosphodiesterase (5'-nucleotidase family)